MKIFAGCLLLAVLAGAGCRCLGADLAGAPIAFESVQAERTHRVAGSTNRIVTVRASLEYPSHYGLAPKEHRQLTAFIDNLFNDGTNFTTTVDALARHAFEVVDGVATNGRLSAKADLTLSLGGRVAYADSRYLSYDLEAHGLIRDHLRGTYDRKRQKELALTDLVPSNRFDRLRASLRKDFVKPHKK